MRLRVWFTTALVLTLAACDEVEEPKDGVHRDVHGLTDLHWLAHSGDMALAASGRLNVTVATPSATS